jgi:hypothetical protein
LHPPAGEEGVAAANEKCVEPIACKRCEGCIDLAIRRSIEDL